MVLGCFPLGMFSWTKVPVGWPAANFLQQVVGLRMTITPDRLHRIVNCWKHALTLANLHLSRAEMAIVINVRSGPFKGSAFHQQLQQSCKELFLNLPADNFLYQHLYDDICRDNAASEAADAIGSEGHQKVLWQKLARWMEGSVKHVEAKQSPVVCMGVQGISVPVCGGGGPCILDAPDLSRLAEEVVEYLCFLSAGSSRRVGF